MCFPAAEMLGLTLQQGLFFGILIVAFALLITERLRNDLVGLLIIVALAATKLLSDNDVLAGFGSQPAVRVVACFAVSRAPHHRGLSDTIGSWIGRLSGSSY